VVLKIHVIRQGGHHYYVEDLVPGRAEGSRVAGEVPGVWAGSGIPSLGLCGPVDPFPFGEVLEGRDPRSGRPLRVVQGDRSVAGYDLTFCAPKSVSLLHLLAPREIAAAAGAGHQAAVADALDYLGRDGIGVRRRRHGAVAFLPTTGPVAGQFLHRTSRALDPHLHTHAVVANVAQGVDGVWSTVDSRRLHAHLGAAQALYHARLRFELGDRMGAAFELRPSGLGDVVGVGIGLRRLFSQRAASMDEFLHRRGKRGERVGPWSAAFHTDRPEKDRTVTVEQLIGEWRRRAADLGHDLGDLTLAVGVHRHDPDPRIDRVALRRQLVELTRGERTLARPQLIGVVAASAPAGAPALAIESAADRLLGMSGGPRPDRGRRPGPVGGEQAWSAGRSRWDPADVVRVLDGHRFEPSTEELAGRSDGRLVGRRVGVPVPKAGDRRIEVPELGRPGLGIGR
jgi:conjugative relaxase-like TrwC/TraI family protein